MAEKALEAIPMLDLKSEVDELWHDINAAVQRVLRSGQFILGAEVEAFEEEVAAFLGVKHAVGVNSGTDGLVIALKALGIGPGDEVITTPFTFFATAEAILQVGAAPVFVDIREDSFNVDPDLLEAAVTERTRAVVPVHLFGNPAAMTKIMAMARRHGLKVLEDAAQSFGAEYFGDSEGDAEEADPALVGKAAGAIGDAGAFSFYPTKNLGAYGDGGLVATDDAAVAQAARALRNHGALPDDRFHHTGVGFNSRLDALQAAILRVKLPYVRRWNEARRAHAKAYNDLVADIPGVRPPSIKRGHVFHQYTLRIGGGARDAVMAELREAGVACSVFYGRPVDTLPAVTAAHEPGRGCTRAARTALEALSLPVHPWLGVDAPRRVRRVLEAIGRGSRVPTG